MGEKLESSVNPKPSREIQNIFDSDKLTINMRKTLRNYYLSLYYCKEDTKIVCLNRLKKYGEFLMSKGIDTFQDSQRQDIDAFLSNHPKASYKNLSIAIFKKFYPFLGHIWYALTDLGRRMKQRGRLIITQGWAGVNIQYARQRRLSEQKFLRKCKHCPDRVKGSVRVNRRGEFIIECLRKNCE